MTLQRASLSSYSLFLPVPPHITLSGYETLNHYHFVGNQVTITVTWGFHDIACAKAETTHDTYYR